MEKYVCVFPDYSAPPLWTKDEGPIEYEDISLSDGLKYELKQMAKSFEMEETYLPNTEIAHNYMVWSYRLALKVKKELPDWTVAFLNINNELGLDLPIVDHRSVVPDISEQ